MRYKPERALTPEFYCGADTTADNVEMRYKPERALTPRDLAPTLLAVDFSRNEV